MIQKQVRLKNNREPLQIPYPSDFKGEKSGSEEDAEFYLSVEPRCLTPEEIDLAKAFVEKLPYPQSLELTGLYLTDPYDALLESDHETLDILEKQNGMLSTRQIPQGGERQLRERVYIIRERGFSGNYTKTLAPGK
jgi:hypothetical protein